MVISKNGKRKRKDAPPVVEVTPEVPKRTKVQAQRKFAQGQGCSSSYSSNPSAATQQNTPVKDTSSRNEPPTELLPNRRPNTEDFLTFLCFRGTPVLPSHLDYFNTNRAAAAAAAAASTGPSTASASDKQESETTNSDKKLPAKLEDEPEPGGSTANQSSIPAASGSSSKSSKSQVKNATKKLSVDKGESEETAPESDTIKVVAKQKFIPFAVRKHAETVSVGKRRQAPSNAVQALKKKYQEQRMAKTQVQNLSKAAQRSRTTRSGANEEQPSNDEHSDEEITEDIAMVNKSNNGKKNSKKKPGTAADIVETLVEPTKTARKSVKDGRCGKFKGSSRNTTDVFDFDSELPADELEKTSKNTRQKPETTVSKQQLTKTVPAVVAKVETPVQPEVKKPTRAKPLKKEHNQLPTRMTRQHAYAYPESFKKAEAAELISLQLEQKAAESQRDKSTAKEDILAEFSSDDDRPLVKVTPKKTAARKSVNKRGNKSQDDAKLPEPVEVNAAPKNLKRSSTTPPALNRQSTIVDEPNVTKASSAKVNVTPSQISVESPLSKKKPNASKKLIDSIDKTKTTAMKPADDIAVEPPMTSNKRKSQSKAKTSAAKPSKHDSASEAESVNQPTTEITKVVASKKKRRNEFTDLQADKSEIEGRSSRPMRRTKEAAAIYMGLIRQKLNDESDEENYSNDSFPELPNVRKTEQMENELKANVGREIKVGPSKKQKVTAEIDVHITGDAKVPHVRQAPVRKGKRAIENALVSETPVQLERSFSDSDEEPLATKIVKKKRAKTTRKPKETSTGPLLVASAPVIVEAIQEIIESVKVESSSTLIQIPTPLQYETAKNLPETVVVPPIDYSLTSTPKSEAPPRTLPSSIVVPKFEPTVRLKIETDQRMTQRPLTVNQLLGSPFKSPADSSSQMASPTLAISPMKSSKEDFRVLQSPSTPVRSSSQQQHAKQSVMDTGGGTSTQSVSAILANLMPSKEESGKIFGIASVSLAQSSGPNDTKCTLGKCGSVHKPPLGPVVPTETLLLNEPMTSKERRKAKVNMTHEQIQKWLAECQVNQEAMDDSLDDELDLSVPPKPINYLSTPSPFRELLDSGGGGSGTPTTSATAGPSSSSPRTSKPKPTGQQIGKDRQTATSSVPKGPSLKAKPVLFKDDRKQSDVKEDQSSLDQLIPEKPLKETSLSMQAQEPDLFQHQNQESTISRMADRIPVPNIPSPKPATPMNLVISEASKKITETKPSKAKKERKSATPKPSPTSIALKTSSALPSSGKSTPSVSSVAKAVPPPPASPVYSQKRTPVYNTKIIEPSPKRKPVVNTFGAFSPENEASIYSFDKEEDVAPTSTPFRRHSIRDRDDATQSAKKRDEASVTPVKTPQQQEVSLTLSPEDNSKSASIAVEVSMDVTSLPKTKPSVDGNDSDSDGHTFYIPLQGTNMTGAKSDQLIQGVAVKLGTEGPEGPNQRVIMHAKLVTKAQMGSNTTPIPESMANVHEIVKSLIASKEAANGKSVPIGTVQPRFKSGDMATAAGLTTTFTTIVPSTSTSQQATTSPTAAAPPQPGSSGMTRHGSNQSLFSQKSRNTTTTTAAQKQRYKNDAPIQPHNNTAFPRHDDPAQMVEAPIFRPTEKEFQDPMEFFDRISPIAARFGICRIIPPASFKPECKISDDMRFNVYNVYVHKMLHRWGPSAKEFSAIKKYLITQSITLTHPPWIGGMEVDLPRLYHTVQELGGLKDVIEKKKWSRVAEEMCIPKYAQDRATKLDDIYCKYLLPYDTLSPTERQKLFDEVEADWAKTEAKARRNADRPALSDNVSESDENQDSDDEDEDGGSMECIVKGRKMPLSAFFRIARNTMALWFKSTEPTSSEIEVEFWRHVAVRDSHVCVHSGSIDSSGWGYGFPTPGPKTKGSPCAKHPWNLKVLTNNHSSILRSIGSLTGVTVPTLNMGMLFSASCWSRDPHGLPWIEYLHTGGRKIWYGVPDEQSANFRAAFTALVPTHCQNKTVWLPCDTAMVPPHMLTDRGVSLCRTEQEPGEFVMVFPRAFTSSLCTGYAISESVYFATSSWLDTARDDFKDIHDSCEPALFSLEQLLFAVASDARTTNETLEIVLPMITEVYERECAERDSIKAAGVTKFEKIPLKNNKKSNSSAAAPAADNECDVCRANLYISWVRTDDDNIYCLQHCLKYINNERLLPKQCRLITTYSVDDVEQLISKITDRTSGGKASTSSQHTSSKNRKSGKGSRS